MKKKKSKSVKKKEALVGAPLEDIGSWLMPQILHRPQRRDYILKIYKPVGCVFCNAVENNKNSDGLLVFKNEHAALILNKFPYNTGHLLIVPHKHCENIYDLSETQYAAFSKMLPFAVKGLKQAFNCQGFNVGMNIGKAGGAGIPEHLHQHVIPRWVGDANFLPLIAKTKVMIESLEQVQERLTKVFKELI